jgi:hypothetical protein
MFFSRYNKKLQSKIEKLYGFFTLTNIELLSILFLINVVPSFLFVYLNLSSLALGLTLSAFILYFYDFNYISSHRFRKTEKILLWFVFCLLVCYGCLGLFLTGANKPFFSLIIIICFILPFSIYKRLSLVDYNSMYSVFVVLTFLLAIFGWYSVFFDVKVMNYGTLNRGVFPFSEPSHYALSFGVLAVSLVSVSSNLISIILILNCFVFALAYPSLVFLFFSFLGTLLFVLRFNFIFRFSIFLICALVFLCVIIKNEHFVSRVDFASLTNLSVLVWVQGWELAFVNFLDTHGVGLGFNSLGLPGTVFSTSTEKIYNLYKFNSNIYDGGFLASKLIAEFGFFGLSVVLLYVYWIMHFFLKINKMYKKISSLDENKNKSQLWIVKKDVLISTVLFTFSVEVFLRGYGYFSPGVVLAVSSFWYLSSTKKKL